MSSVFHQDVIPLICSPQHSSLALFCVAVTLAGQEIRGGHVAASRTGVPNGPLVTSNTRARARRSLGPELSSKLCVVSRVGRWLNISNGAALSERQQKPSALQIRTVRTRQPDFFILDPLALHW